MVGVVVEVSIPNGDGDEEAHDVCYAVEDLVVARVVARVGLRMAIHAYLALDVEVQHVVEGEDRVAK